MRVAVKPAVWGSRQALGADDAARRRVRRAGRHRPGGGLRIRLLAGLRLRLRIRAHRDRAGRELERDLLLEHLDSAVRQRDEPVELLPYAAIGDLALGRGRGLVDRDGQQLLGGVETLSLVLAERRVPEAP